MTKRATATAGDTPVSQHMSLLPNLAERLRAAMLPGDQPLAEDALEAAARFVLTTAAQRVPGQPAIAIETVAGDDSGQRRFMRIAVINDDMPFLVDSLASTVAARGVGIDRLVHPVLAVRRDGANALTDLPEGAAAVGERRESMVYMEAQRVDARGRKALAAALADTLGDVQAAVKDWPAMQAAMAADADRTGDSEGAALLRWLKDGMLTQLGHITHHRDGTLGDALGICRRDTQGILGDMSYARAYEWFEQPGVRAPLIVKSNRISAVHRRTPLDLFIVPVVEGGQVRALSVHAGIWTSAALAAPPMQVPRLRQQLGALSHKFGFDPGGHAGKALVHALTALPHDIVVSFDDRDLERTATTMMSLIDRPRPRLVLVAAPLARHLFVFVWLPRETISTSTRVQIQAMVEQGCAAPVLDWSMEIEGPLALLRFVLDLKLGAEVPAEDPLDAQLQALVRGWAGAVEAELARAEDPARAAALAGRYADAFPLAYRSDHGPAEAAIDIGYLRRLSDVGSRRAVRFHQVSANGSGQLRLKLYQRHGSLALTEAVPALENFGFRVIEDVPTALVARGETLATIHDFLLDLPAGAGAGLMSHAPMVEDALAAVLNGSGEDDGFNRLITGAGLSAREANWLRAFYRYLRQAGLSFGIVTVVEALANAPEVALGLIDLFRARHEPGRSNRDALVAEAEARIRDGLGKVAAINDDRLLRRYHALVGAILRTNAFTPHAAEALAFKLDSALVPGLPRPVPWREIWVYGGRVEGIHLRSGPVARGGIRWSDRRDDFRTEILGLMKAQRVKNAVIVPTGAKGGFYPKRLPDPARDRDGWLAEGKASYELFIRTLLTITDNIVEGQVVHPAGVEIRDGEDPYFVVAADKGTATFSDTANGIAASVDFWLDDAFASGGSKGYDHKAMGITARGAWLSVQRHFLELGIDVQTDPVRVVGCGDMSGDVFGNGMLLSRSIRLVAAFDHRHVFLDPAPDPAASWAERNRLFALPRSSWDDYDKALISPGGGVFPRSLKEIPLSPEVRAALGIAAETIDPDGLITAILKSPVDLLWFGGIGTYVKGAGENNVDVGDPANDALRVNGSDLKVRVIGEGANLGCTQAGRIEFALQGGRNNTDFIDNSAGVDCSDKEVNIKIALAAAKRSSRLSEPDRVALLGEMTDAVAALVLEDNRLQALALSIAESGGPTVAATQFRLIDVLEAGGQLDRQTEGLADRATLARRTAEGHGLTRPELAVILSSAKLAVQDALENSALPDDPAMLGELLAAFPPEMRERFAPEIEGHRLRREIVATRLANRVINRIGMVHPFELMEEEGATAAQVIAAFFAAEQLFGLSALWQALEETAMPEPARLRLFAEAAVATRTHMADLLRAGGGTLVPSTLVADLLPATSALAAAAGSLVAGDTLTLAGRREADLIAIGAPAALAAQVARLYALDGSVGLARLARDSGAEPISLTRAFIDLGARLGLDWAQGAAARLDPADPWERLLVAGLARDFQQMRLDFLRHGHADMGSDPLVGVAQWAAAQDTAIRQFRAMVARAQTALAASPAMLAQIASQARNLLGR